VTPLLLEERYYPLVECRLVWRRMVVAFTSCEACIRDLREKARHLLVGRVRLPIKDQHWHINVAERLGGPQRGDRAANYRCKHLRVYAGNASRDQTGRGEVSGNNFSLFQNTCSLLGPNPAGLYLGRVQHKQASRRAASHRETDDVDCVQTQVLIRARTSRAMAESA